MAWQSGAGPSRRPGGASDQVQIHIGNDFDFDKEVDGLRAHVGKIKQISMAIDEERKQQGEIIDQLDESMANAKLVLDRTMKRLNVAWNHARSNHMLVLVLSAILLFFAIYVFAKIYRVGRFVMGRG
mmetsp:Transcript_2932/g.7914  ORF Transcript_2932/g.7914 Transcript_2932/m.7914 type:complete len:127 (-) Transcript_2932:1371-1751(-)